MPANTKANTTVENAFFMFENPSLLEIGAKSDLDLVATD